MDDVDLYIGGGAVTLAGVLIALAHGRRQQTVADSLVIKRDRDAAYREELRFRRAQFQHWRRVAVKSIETLQSTVAAAIGDNESSGKMLDRPDSLQDLRR